MTIVTLWKYDCGNGLMGYAKMKKIILIILTLGYLRILNLEEAQKTMRLLRIA